MSNEESLPEEWKTIRVPATSYYKLVELSGLLTAVLGIKVPMSSIANWAITIYHDEYYIKLRDVMFNPDAIEKIRERLGGKIKRLSELFTTISE